MLIINDKLVAKKVQHSITLGQKARGLMFSKENKDLALVFHFPRPQIVSLHMCFVSYPIDVLYLDEERKVIEIKQDFRPWKYYRPDNKAKYVIEMSAGKVKEHGLKIGDTADW